jgi:predicted metal-dependent hydrolase
MRKALANRPGSSAFTVLDGRKIEFRLRPSKTATKLRVRVGPTGVEVIRPEGREEGDVLPFLQAHSSWVLSQMNRVERLRGLRRQQCNNAGKILFHGIPTAVVISDNLKGAGANQVIWDARKIIVIRGKSSLTPPAQTLENWLRKQARNRVAIHLEWITEKLKRRPANVLIMGQRTKWGNCSKLQNLSFNWRLIMAPDSVLRYIVIHEAVHLAIPDHSQKFWLTVRSLCPETERAKQWLCANSHHLQIDLDEVCITAV